MTVTHIPRPGHGFVHPEYRGPAARDTLKWVRDGLRNWMDELDIQSCTSVPQEQGPLRKWKDMVEEKGSFTFTHSRHHTFHKVHLHHHPHLFARHIVNDPACGATFSPRNSGMSTHFLNYRVRREAYQDLCGTFLALDDTRYGEYRCLDERRVEIPDGNGGGIFSYESLSFLIFERFSIYAGNAVRYHKDKFHVDSLRLDTLKRFDI